MSCLWLKMASDSVLWLERPHRTYLYSNPHVRSKTASPATLASPEGTAGGGRRTTAMCERLTLGPRPPNLVQALQDRQPIKIFLYMHVKEFARKSNTGDNPEP